MTIITYFAKLSLVVFIAFAKNALGIARRPYETIRALSLSKNYVQIIFIWLLIFAYISLASLLRKGISAGPLFLTLHWGKIFSGIVITFVLSWGALYYLGLLVGGKGKPKNLFLPWSFSLIPTLLWFLTTSFFYFFLPPPRTQSLKGQLFSIVFLALTTTLFYWKCVSYYLTLRFGHLLNLKQVIIVSLFFVPLLLLYALATYKLGIFKIPFV